MKFIMALIFLEVSLWTFIIKQHMWENHLQKGVSINISEPNKSRAKNKTCL